MMGCPACARCDDWVLMASEGAIRQPPAAPPPPCPEPGAGLRALRSQHPSRQPLAPAPAPSCPWLPHLPRWVEPEK